MTGVRIVATLRRFTCLARPAVTAPRLSCVDALPDQVALELGQRPEDVEDELAAAGW